MVEKNSDDNKMVIMLLSCKLLVRTRASIAHKMLKKPMNNVQLNTFHPLMKRSETSSYERDIFKK